MIPDCSVTGPCGHTTDFDLTCVSRDHFACAMCGCELHVVQASPIQHPSGWIEPGKRTLVPGTPSKPVKPKGRRAA